MSSLGGKPSFTLVFQVQVPLHILSVIFLQLLSNWKEQIGSQGRHWQRQCGNTCSKGQGKCGDFAFEKQQALGAPFSRWLPFAAPGFCVEKCRIPLKHRLATQTLPKFSLVFCSCGNFPNDVPLSLPVCCFSLSCLPSKSWYSPEAFCPA